ncbi:Arginyl-tRNA--protein transferase [Rhynchospora pubera]|uniref:Arginyl-tRNA--protein transferase n=1 Tax=Rhynchospora pubera TaxID=906938 RepID=A0AAV8DY25_9POAL|nr:Arginyl-tRNA--protein transferase [Rhynchospora pubera]
MDADVASNSGGGKEPGQGKRKRSGEEKGKELSVIVDYGRRRSLCDYCFSSSPSKISHAYNLTSNDYQDLVDRGWRRSGCIVYKPEMDKTCCPQYTIRLKASDFTSSKEQERVLKKMQRYLAGALDSKVDKSNEMSKPNLLKNEPYKSTDSRKSSNTDQTSLVFLTVPPKEIENEEKFLSFLSDIIDNGINEFLQRRGLPLTGQNPKSVVKRVKPQIKRKLKDIVTKEEELVYTCNVSFQIEAYIKKVESKIESMDLISPNIIAEELAKTISSQNLSGSTVKACNGHLNFQSVAKQETVVVEPVEKPVQPQETPRRDYDTPKKRRRLEIRMKRSEFDPEEYVIYEKYQKLVHQDTEISIESYIEFLVDTPIPFVQPDCSSRIPPCGLGSFHQQYLLDGRIIAVGVVSCPNVCQVNIYFGTLILHFYPWENSRL